MCVCPCDRICILDLACNSINTYLSNVMNFLYTHDLNEYGQVENTIMLKMCPITAQVYPHQNNSVY